MPEIYSVILSNQSIKNLTSIVEYIAAENPDSADKIGLELVTLAMSLNFMPYRGSKVKKRLGVLKLVHGNFRRLRSLPIRRLLIGSYRRRALWPQCNPQEPGSLLLRSPI